MVTMAPDSLNNKHIQNHDGGPKLIVRAAGLEVIWNPGCASGHHLVELMAPLGGADGAGLSEQQAHPESGGPVVDDSLTLGTQLRRVMQSRGQRGGDFPFVSTDEFVRATSVSVPECVLNAPSGSSVPAPASPLQPFAAVDPEELGEREGLPRRRWKSCAARHLVMSLAFLLMLLPLKGQKY